MFTFQEEKKCDAIGIPQDSTIFNLKEHQIIVDFYRIFVLTIKLNYRNSTYIEMFYLKVINLENEDINQKKIS